MRTPLIIIVHFTKREKMKSGIIIKSIIIIVRIMYNFKNIQYNFLNQYFNLAREYCFSIITTQNECNSLFFKFLFKPFPRACHLRLLYFFLLLNTKAHVMYVHILLHSCTYVIYKGNK